MGTVSSAKLQHPDFLKQYKKCSMKELYAFEKIFIAKFAATCIGQPGRMANCCTLCAFYSIAPLYTNFFFNDGWWCLRTPGPLVTNTSSLKTILYYPFGAIIPLDDFIVSLDKPSYDFIMSVVS